MNIYKILTFDGYSSKEYTISGYDIVSAIQSNSMIIMSNIIKAELIGSGTKETQI